MTDIWIRHFNRNSGFLKHLLTGVDQTMAVTSKGPCNSIAWIVGHLTRTRANILKMLGANVELQAWEELVVRGAEKNPNPGPSITDLTTLFMTRGDDITQTLRSCDAALFAKPSGRSFPDGGKTIGDGIDFLIFHETFHLGQIDLLRITFGLSGIP